MKTLMIAPHMDDESISCGGLLYKRAHHGGVVHVFALFGRHYADIGYDQQGASDERERADFDLACKLLGVTGDAVCLKEGEPGEVGYYALLGEIESLVSWFKPDEVIIPSGLDLNQDHRHLAHACQIVFRPSNLGKVQRVLEFIGLDGRVRQPNFYAALTRGDLYAKQSAINCYQRERRAVPSPRAPQNVEAQAMVWGAASGCEYAEGYTVYLERGRQCASA